MCGTRMRASCITTQLRAGTVEIRHVAVFASSQPRVELRSGGRLTQRGNPRQVEAKAVGLRLETLRECPAFCAQGCRPTQRANAITSSAGGMAASSPYAVYMRHFT